MADALDESRDKTIAGKRASLEAMANHGSAGVADLAAQQQVIRSSHDAALSTLTEEAVGRGAPAAALGQLTDIAGQPGANAARIMGSAGDAYAADAARLQTAHGNYMDEANAAIPVIRADADRRIGILREQWEQRKKLQEEQDQSDFLDMPQYLQEAYLNATLAAGPEGMSAIDGELATLAPQIAEEEAALGIDKPIEVHGRGGRVIPTKAAGAPWSPGARVDADGRVFVPDDKSDTGYRLLEGANAGDQGLIGPMDADPPPRTSARLDMLKTRRDQLLEQKDTLVPSGEGEWNPQNPNDVAAAYQALGVDPMAAAGLAMGYVDENTPDEPTNSEIAADVNARNNLEAQAHGYSSYADFVSQTGMTFDEDGNIVEGGPRKPGARGEGIIDPYKAGDQLGYDEELVAGISAADYYKQAVETAQEALDDRVGDPKGPPTWDEVQGAIEEGWVKEYGEDRAKKFGRTLALIHEMYRDSFR